MYSSNIIWKYLFQMVCLIVSIFILYHLKISFTRKHLYKDYLWLKTKNEQTNSMTKDHFKSNTKHFIRYTRWTVSIYISSFRNVKSFFKSCTARNNTKAYLHVVRGDHISQYVNGVIVGQSTEDSKVWFC